MADQYRIQKRGFSSNIIEIGKTNEHGKVQWSPYVAPLGNKVDGDKVCDFIFASLNEFEKWKSNES